jgi:tetratricopeptide (TPR) repeat protein
MSEKPGSTLGYERRFNRLLGLDDEEAFVTELTSELAPQPPNFKRIVALNQGPLLTEATALEPLDPARDADATCRLLHLRGTAHVQARQLGAACEAFETARDLVERAEISDPRLRARIAIALGTCYRRLERPTKALEAYHQGQAIASRSSDLRLAAQGLMGAAVAHYDAGELDGAIASYERALTLFERVADSGFELSVLQSLAAVHVELGQLDEARALAERVRSRAETIGANDWVPIADTILARVTLGEGRSADALTLATAAEQILAARGDRRQQADALRVIGAANGALGQEKRADRAYRRAIKRLSELDDRVDLAAVATEYSKLLRSRGEIAAAFEMLELASSRLAPGAKPPDP